MSKSQLVRVSRDRRSVLDGLLGQPEHDRTSNSADLRSPSAVADPVTRLPTYRIGVLGATTTDNFWAAQDIAANVWNSYVLSPTKPSLYMVKYPGMEVGAELADTTAMPQPRASGGQMGGVGPNSTRCRVERR